MTCRIWGSPSWGSLQIPKVILESLLFPLAGGWAKKLIAQVRGPAVPGHGESPDFSIGTTIPQYWLKGTSPVQKNPMDSWVHHHFYSFFLSFKCYILWLFHGIPIFRETRFWRRMALSIPSTTIIPTGDPLWTNRHLLGEATSTRKWSCWI